MRRKIVAGNWKMNKTLSKGKQLVEEILSSTDASSDVLKIIAPPFIHLAAIADMVRLRTDFAVAAQDCHHINAGAYTGEVSAEMIASTGAEFVIIGHSERRLNAGESKILGLKIIETQQITGINKFIINFSSDALEYCVNQISVDIFNDNEPDAKNKK